MTRTRKIEDFISPDNTEQYWESVVKAVEDAHQEELRCKIEAEVIQKLSDQFTRYLAESQAALEKKFQK